MTSSGAAPRKVIVMSSLALQIVFFFFVKTRARCAPIACMTSSLAHCMLNVATI